MSTFVNFSNHPSAVWGKDQLTAAQSFGDIIDIPFPSVPASATEAEVGMLAEKSAENIMKYDSATVMCQGEFTLTLYVVRLLQSRGVKCVCACSERVVEEQNMADGTTRKNSVFKFVQFREYTTL